MGEKKGVFFLKASIPPKTKNKTAFCFRMDTYGWCFLPSASCPCVISCAYIWLALPSLARWLQSLYNPFRRDCGGLQKWALLSHAVLLFTGSNEIYSYWVEVFLSCFILALMPSDQDNRGGRGPLIWTRWEELLKIVCWETCDSVTALCALITEYRSSVQPL